jgi:hypothetical protein
MASQHRGFPFRWVLPFLQLAVCLALLWPVRSFLFFGIAGLMGSHSSWAQSAAGSNSNENYVPSTSPEVQRDADAASKLGDMRTKAALALDFPVLVAQLPYILLNPAKREWVPKGMFPDIWRMLSWPFAGMFFWWFWGKDIEALLAARRNLLHPRIGWTETAFAVILFGVGLVSLAGILTSTPDDRRDTQFIALVAGGLMWGVLATVTIAARFLQWRIRKRTELAPAG